jgi:peptidyl-prolyl cis-trans isomerase C
MSYPVKLLSALALAVALSAPAVADDAPDANTVVASVNGQDITLGQMIVVRASLPEEYQELPNEVLFTGILDQLVQQEVLAQSNTAEPSLRVQLTLANEKRALMASDAIERLLADGISEDAIKAAYDSQYGTSEPEKEFRAAHILVETEEAAKALITHLEGGADFATLARDNSTGPSGPNGGELGWFSPGMMVKPFEDAVMAMQDGQISAPVKTRFGWHVIKLEESRQKEAPTLESVREELEVDVRQMAIQTHIETLEKAATVTRVETGKIDPELLGDLSLLEN